MTMVSVKIAELSGRALDYAVAVCEGHSGWMSSDDDEHPSDGHFTERRGAYFHGSLETLGYSHDWSLAGPIIEREGISFRQYYRPGASGHGTFYARVCRESGQTVHWSRQTSSTGPTPIVAAMRCYVASKTQGDSVMIPEELTNG